MKKTIISFVLAGIATLTQAQAQEVRSSGSNYLKPVVKFNVAVPFSIADPGRQFPIRWGMDVAWLDRQNMLSGINYIGKKNISYVRGSFQTNHALENDSVLTSDQIDMLKQRMTVARLAGDTVKIILNEDQEQGIISYYGTRGASNVDHWAALINSSVKWIQENYPRNKVVAVSPFNEPDYADWNQGSKANFKAIAKKLKEDYPRFADIAITAGNTLNNDFALEWYNAVKPYVTWGNTHQLAGSFDSYANFFKTVEADGNVVYADELHNVGEIIVGAEYGVTDAIWWGFDGRARGEFCQISNQGSRIGYGENRSAWTSAAVYRDDTNGNVRAFVGSSERQANTSSFNFISRDREVFYNSYGPVRELRHEVPGGTAYKTGQTNAECVMNVNYGEDVPPSPIVAGRYKLMCRANKYLVSAAGLYNDHTNICIRSDKKLDYQYWDIEPISSRIGGDYSYYKITNANSGKYMNVLDNSMSSGANVIAYNADCDKNEQWSLEYAGDGCYYLRNRKTGMYLESEKTTAEDYGNIRQASKSTGTLAQRRAQMFRLLPVDVNCEVAAPKAPTGLQAEGQLASVRLSWNENTEKDLAGYNVLRREADGNEWNTIARKVTTNYYVDNTCRQGINYMYKLKALDKAENASQVSDSVAAATTGEKGLVAQWQFEGSLNDTTANWMDCVHSSTPSFNTTSFKQGSQSLRLSGSSYLRLPYEVADMNEMTIAFWVYWNGGSNWQRIFDFGNGEQEYMFLTPNNGSVMRFAIKNGGDEQLMSCPVLESKAWHHVAVTIGNGRASLVVDGVEKAYNNSLTITPDMFRPVMNYIGRSQFNNDPIFSGLIDDLRIYNYALSAEQLKALIDETTGIGDAAHLNDKSKMINETFDLQGRKLEQPARGISIRKAADGTAQKVLMK